MHQTKNKNSYISELYKEVATAVPPKEMQEIVHFAFQDFCKRNQKKSVAEKCVEFALLRQTILASFELPTDPIQLREVGNSMLDYIDMTFCYLFFHDRTKKKIALHKMIDNEFYFCLLAFVLDRIEFPSLVFDKVKESCEFNNRLSIKLDRRNYLATLMFTAKQFTNGLIVSLAHYYNTSPSYAQIKKHYRKELHKLNSTAVANYSKSSKYLQNRTKNNSVRLFRGYEIDKSQNVLIDRKTRMQDANKAISFSTEPKVARMFATYRNQVMSSPEWTSFYDRLTLAQTMFHDIPESYERSTGKKFIVSEYEMPQNDIILCALSTTVTECEVFAFPDNAKLSRYEIVFAT